ncbi:proteasome assembly chaperone family protein [Devriesea agamarum]|uniref:proteasome assembly chaperone family protein n=1 Tax=Devriesea agamarum TaxID=472569 RepID=UPI00071D8D6F|nr:PAC2 family protein [Devriesea agamarum]
MRDPRELYTFASDEVVAAVPRGGLVLVHALPGFIDAGNACRIASTYLKDTLRTVRLLTFETDEILDYRGSRPQTIFTGRAFGPLEIPEIALYLMYDEADRPFLFLDGPEPDLQWRRMSRALIDIVEYFEVDLTVSMHAIPMAVPHTRPIGLVAHATDEGLLGEVDRDTEATAEFVVPAGFYAMLETMLGAEGHDALGYAAQIPHYLTRSDFPAGALALLRRVSEAARLDIPLVNLGDMAEAAAKTLEGTVKDNDEMLRMVAELEEQYDSLQDADGSSLLATTVDMPTAAEIGDHFERFLATQEPPASDDR